MAKQHASLQFDNERKRNHIKQFKNPLIEYFLSCDPNPSVLLLPGCSEEDEKNGYSNITRQIELILSNNVPQENIYACERNKIVFNRIKKGFQLLSYNQVQLNHKEVFSQATKLLIASKNTNWLFDLDLCGWNMSNQQDKIIALFQQYPNNLLGIFVNTSHIRRSNEEVKEHTELFISKCKELNLTCIPCTYRGINTYMTEFFITNKPIPQHIMNTINSQKNILNNSSKECIKVLIPVHQLDGTVINQSFSFDNINHANIAQTEGTWRINPSRPDCARFYSSETNKSISFSKEYLNHPSKKPRRLKGYDEFNFTLEAFGLSTPMTPIQVTMLDKNKQVPSNISFEITVTINGLTITASPEHIRLLYNIK